MIFTFSEETSPQIKITMKKIKLIFFAAATSTLLLAACSKNKDTSTLQVRLTDAPLSVDEVNVEILEVEVKLQEGETPVREDSLGGDREWVRLETNRGIYNLLELQNGVDTVLGTATLPVGTIKEIRFVLGDNNTIRENGVEYPLEIPSGSSSGLKIKIEKPLRADLETLVIDFDAALSVKKEGNGDYKLRPVLRVK